MYGEYLSRCSFPDCQGKLLIEQAASAGLTIGTLVPPSPYDEKYGRCPICKRHTMVIVEAPEIPIVHIETGFTKIPTE